MVCSSTSGPLSTLRIKPCSQSWKIQAFNTLSRNKTLHILLPRTLRNPIIQNPMSEPLSSQGGTWIVEIWCPVKHEANLVNGFHGKFEDRGRNLEKDCCNTSLRRKRFIYSLFIIVNWERKTDLLVPRIITIFLLLRGRERRKVHDDYGKKFAPRVAAANPRRRLKDERTQLLGTRHKRSSPNLHFSSRPTDLPHPPPSLPSHALSRTPSSWTSPYDSSSLVSSHGLNLSSLLYANPHAMLSSRSFCLFFFSSSLPTPLGRAPLFPKILQKSAPSVRFWLAPRTFN